jgi:hypothetical protein
MESKRVFYDGMDNDPADYNALQGFAQTSMEHIVADGITAARKFAGFQISITGAAEITVQPGRLYSGGKVYDRPDAYVRDFTTSLPIATKKHVLVVIFGSEVDTDSRPREFLINEETGASEPRVVALERRRVANINTAAGSESPDPLDPIVDSGVLAVARVVLTATGVESVTNLLENKLDSVASLADRTSSLETFRNTTAPQVESLASDLAALGVQANGNVGREVYGRMLARLAVLEENAGIPSNATDSDADFFLDKDESDTANVAFVAKVQEGIRFADDAADESQLQIFDALNPKAKITGGVMFPAYTRSLRLAVGPRQAEVQVSAYSYQTHEMVQKQMARTRIRYGESFTVCSNSAWWQTGEYDYETETFTRNGETFNVFNATRNVGAHDIVRVRRFWADTYYEPYWDRVTVDRSVPGAQVAETFLNANDMWLDAVGLTFTRLAATGGITLAICETDRGAPDLNKVISFTTLDRADMVLNDETVVPIQPAFLRGGTRYAIVIVSAADHWLATTQGTNFPQGTFFYVLDGAYQQGDGSRDICFSLYAAKFTQSRAVIEMSPLSLSGGITSLDILSGAIVPDSTDLTYEVRVGSVWTPIAAAEESILGAGGTIPPLLPLRAVFTGTPDVMPAIQLTDSRVLVSRPKTTMTHISAARTLPAPSTSIRVIGRLEFFDAVHHTATAKLRTGAGFTTVVNASSFVDALQADGSIERTWLFNLGAAVSTYKIQLEGTTDAVLRQWHYGWRKDYAL